MVLEQILYSILFISGALLVKPLGERLAICIAALLFTVPTFLCIQCDLNGSVVLLIFAVAELLGALILPRLLSGIRAKLILILQLIAASYFVWEYSQWDVYSWTWQYYEIIQQIFLDSTLAILIINPTRILTIIHFIIYSGVLWFLPKYLNGLL